MSIFSSIRLKKPKRTAFDLSHEVKLTCDMGELVPFFLQEVLPGDTFKVSVETLVRFAPMIAPVMHRVNVYTHFFFVPNRLIWDDWKDFITGGEDGDAEPVFPKIFFSGESNPSVAKAVDPIEAFESGGLADYLGVPPYDLGDEHSWWAQINLLPFRAYALIWNEYYRDQNLQDEIPFSKASGIFSAYRNFTDTSTSSHDGCNELLVLRHRCWEKDYFTSALPFPQRLPNPVTVPVAATDAPVYLADPTPSMFNYQRVLSTGDGTGDLFVRKKDGILEVNASDKDGEQYHPTLIDPNGTFKADLTDATGVTINELRRAFSLQRWLENNARAGSRYIEQILSHFGVRSSDARLQRPEYLGGGKTPVVVSEVMQTSETSESPQGNLAGNATSYGRSHSFKKFFEEHGLVLGILSVMPRTAYQNGLPRLWGKFDKFDYYFPEFAHLGEQEIHNYEIYFSHTHTLDYDATANDPGSLFGYSPRYAEYRFVNGSVHGDFRSTLAFWHMGRIFNQQPHLNGSFVAATAPSKDTGFNRVFAVQDPGYDRLWIQMYVNFKALRPLPKYGTPGL